MMYIDDKQNEITDTQSGEIIFEKEFIRCLGNLELSSFEGSLAQYSDEIELVDKHNKRIRKFNGLMNYKTERGSKDIIHCFNEKEVREILHFADITNYLRITLNNGNIKEMFYFKKVELDKWVFVNILVEEL